MIKLIRKPGTFPNFLIFRFRFATGRLYGPGKWRFIWEFHRTPGRCPWGWDLRFGTPLFFLVTWGGWPDE